MNDNTSSGSSEITNSKPEPEVIPKDSSEKPINNAREAPAQKTLISKIALAKDRLLLILRQRDVGLAEVSNSDIQKARDDVKNLEKQLKRLINVAEANRKAREKKRKLFEALEEKYPEDNMKLVKKIGRPALENDQPEILKVICELAKQGAGADGRRRCEALNSCMTLDDLHNELKENHGLMLSRTATYLRLLPRNYSTVEGKRHVTTVPVRLCKPQNNQRRAHADSEFCKMTINHLKELSATLTSQDVVFLSVDDKCRVPIGITAAKNQSPLIMHLDYRVRLPDHDFVKAARHKLIPSVYAGLVIKDGKPCDPTRVSYSGPTYIAIRSAKHDSSTAETHAFDLDNVMTLPEFSKLVRREDSTVKPVLIITSDGGPDENPRYEKVQLAAIETFKKFDLDAVFLATNAPGRSAYNAVERRMAPLSRQLSGLVLPHDHFGNHLDSSGKTVDVEKEKKNFEAAANVLSEVWNSTVIDDYPVVAKYQAPGSERISSEVCQSWKRTHMRCSTYLCQIVKCDDRSCCTPKRSNIGSILKNHFLPVPVPVSEGLTIQKGGAYLPLCAAQLMQDAAKLKQTSSNVSEIAYDLFLPSINDEILKKRICVKCDIYHCTLKALKDHSKVCGKAMIIEKMKPKRIAARRRTELLACFRDDDDLQWIDKDECDFSADLKSDLPNISDEIPIIELMEPTWEEL